MNAFTSGFTNTAVRQPVYRPSLCPPVSVDVLAASPDGRERHVRPDEVATRPGNVPMALQ